MSCSQFAYYEQLVTKRLGIFLAFLRTSDNSNESEALTAIHTYFFYKHALYWFYLCTCISVVVSNIYDSNAKSTAILCITLTTWPPLQGRTNEDWPGCHDDVHTKVIDMFYTKPSFIFRFTYINMLANMFFVIF